MPGLSVVAGAGPALLRGGARRGRARTGAYLEGGGGSAATRRGWQPRWPRGVARGVARTPAPLRGSRSKQRRASAHGPGQGMGWVSGCRGLARGWCGGRPAPCEGSRSLADPVAAARVSWESFSRAFHLFESVFITAYEETLTSFLLVVRHFASGGDFSTRLLKHMVLSRAGEDPGSILVVQGACPACPRGR